jgi:hypothetical protein
MFGVGLAWMWPGATPLHGHAKGQVCKDVPRAKIEASGEIRVQSRAQSRGTQGQACMDVPVAELARTCTRLGLHRCTLAKLA